MSSRIAEKPKGQQAGPYLQEPKELKKIYRNLRLFPSGGSWENGRGMTIVGPPKAKEEA